MTAFTLACGRDPVAVADAAAADTLDEHSRTCPYCRVAVAEAEVSGRIGQQTADEPVAPPADLVPAVMRTVRTELRRTREIPLASPDGAAFVTDHVVTTSLRAALDTVPGLVVTSCRLEIGDDGSLGVRVGVVARYGTALLPAADSARVVVAATLQVQFGLVPTSGVDVDVTDLVTDLVAVL